MTKQQVGFMKYVAVVVVCLFALLIVAGNTRANTSCVRGASAESTFSYYSQLSDNAKKFYDAIGKMNKDGVLLSGNEKFDLIANKVLTESQVKDFQNGSSKLLKEFGAGKDAFYLDHPEIFYINFDNLSLSFATQNGKYTAHIDAGRRATYNLDGYTTVAGVEAAKTELNNVLTGRVNALNAVAGADEKVKVANEIVCDAVTYDFCASEPDKAAAIRTTYGALVNGKAVCEGYARAFKTLMDSQNIECVIVVGYFYNDNGQLEPHAWNNVRLDGKWYLVDCTMNDSAKTTDTYTLLGAESVIEYEPNGVISSSGFEFEYPVLATYNYGLEALQTQVNYDNGTISAKYEGKTALELVEEGKYILCAHETDEGWSNYYSLAVQNLTEAHFNVHCLSTKFIATTQAPTDTTGIYASIEEDKIFAKSDVIYNEQYDVTAYTPNVRNVSPSNTAILDARNTYLITIEYDSVLQKEDESKPVGIKVYSEKDSELQKYVTIEDVTFDGAKKVSFKITPSKMYKHDTLSYHMTPTNLVSSANGANPRTVSYVFAKPWSVCSKVYDNGRLYMDVYGEPTLIDNQDLSLTGFVDESGKQIAESQRSQLVMVASKPSDETASDMMDSSLDKAGVTEKDVKASATYELDLHVCGVVQQIPEGSYLKLAFGFPDGFSAKDKGTTFKVYHFKRGADGKIDPTKTEEIPCVVTEYGLVVVVNSFSPFMVMALDSSKVTSGDASESKSVYAYVTSTGGKVSAKIGETTVAGIATLQENQKIDYTLTPDAGMQVDYVLLNKEKVEVVDNKFTVDYKDLGSNNQIKVAFVATSVAEFEAENKIESLNAEFMSNETIKTGGSSGADGGLIAALFAVLVVVVGGVFAFIYFRKARKAKVNGIQGEQPKEE